MSIEYDTTFRNPTRQVAAAIIDLFEDVLDKHGVTWPNSERDEDPCAAVLYGSEYDELLNDIQYRIELEKQKDVRDDLNGRD